MQGQVDGHDRPGRGQMSGEIEDRAHRRGDRQTLAVDDLVLWQRTPPDVHAGTAPGPGAVWHGDLHRLVRLQVETEEPARGPIGERGLRWEAAVQSAEQVARVIREGGPDVAAPREAPPCGALQPSPGEPGSQGLRDGEGASGQLLGDQR